MSCHEIKNWTCIELVGAFLDLTIAFLLLIGSTLAYLVTKFLGLFRLSLPCPCNGQFGNPNCLQRQLVNNPPRKIGSLQFELKTRFPFDPILSNCCCRVSHSADAEEDSCSSCSTRRSKGFDANAGSKRYKFGIRRRRNGAAGVLVGNGKFSIASRLSALGSSESYGSPLSPASVTSGRSRVLVSCDDVKEASTNGSFLQQVSSNVLNHLDSETNTTDKDMSTAEDFKFPEQLKLDFNKNAKEIVWILEQALEKERTALHLELEKERNASATAADEAMAMILRLQEEKASIEMEKKQYQRMIEEKSVYDAEEMNILKEMLLMRDREKHYLEKELEVYRQMVYENQQIDADVPAMIHDEASFQFEPESRTFSFGKELPIPADEDKQQVDGLSRCQGSISRRTESFNKTTVVDPSNDHIDKIYLGFLALKIDVDPGMHDVHMIDEEYDIPCEFNRNQIKQLSRNATDIRGKSISPTPHTLRTEVDKNKSCSDIANLLSEVGVSRGKAFVADMRRNSMSAVDYERLRIDYEVGRLIEKLKVVQQGREKLNYSVGCWESEKAQMSEKADRNVSLHSSSPKVLAKIKPWRSVSLAAVRSS
ncbi:hypothetical protein ACFE04_026051 [Oxalis oulophora]